MTNFFQDFFMWDTLIHTISGFVFAYIGVKLFRKLNNSIVVNKKSFCLFILSFSLFCGVIWEFFEFTNDFFFLRDMQKDRIVYNFCSDKISRKKSNSIKNIDHTILYNEDNNAIVMIDGYLDIGLIDTMKDLFVNFIGAILFSIIFYLRN